MQLMFYIKKWSKKINKAIITPHIIFYTNNYRIFNALTRKLWITSYIICIFIVLLPWLVICLTGFLQRATKWILRRRRLHSLQLPFFVSFLVGDRSSQWNHHQLHGLTSSRIGILARRFLMPRHFRLHRGYRELNDGGCFISSKLLDGSRNRGWNHGKNETICRKIPTLNRPVYEWYDFRLTLKGILMMTSGFFRLLSDLPKPFWRYPISYLNYGAWALQVNLLQGRIGKLDSV